MPVSIMIHLFSKPAIELNKEGEAIEAAEIRRLAGELNVRLRAVADAVERLSQSGWETEMMLYDVTLTHPYIDSEADARSRVEDLGLDPELFGYMEFEEEEWGDGGEEDFEEL